MRFPRTPFRLGYPTSFFLAQSKMVIISQTTRSGYSLQSKLNNIIECCWRVPVYNTDLLSVLPMSKHTRTWVVGTHTPLRNGVGRVKSLGLTDICHFSPWYEKPVIFIKVLDWAIFSALSNGCHERHGCHGSSVNDTGPDSLTEG